MVSFATACSPLTLDTPQAAWRSNGNPQHCPGISSSGVPRFTVDTGVSIAAGLVHQCALLGRAGQGMDLLWKFVSASQMDLVHDSSLLLKNDGWRLRVFFGISVPNIAWDDWTLNVLGHGQWEVSARSSASGPLLCLVS